MNQIEKRVWLISRKNPKTGFFEMIHFTGNIKQKPKGWMVVEEVCGTTNIDENGLAC